MAGNSSQSGISVSSRLLRLLAAFDAENCELTLSDLARRADLPIGTAHRLVGELEAWGALARLPSGHYVVGRRLWDVGLLAPVQTRLRRAASPFLHDLYRATSATVHLAVRDGHYALCLERLAGNGSIPVLSRVGSRAPLHATAVGKVLLAYAPSEVQQDVLARLVRITPHTVVHPGLLATQLTRVRRDGYATNSEEMELGACAVAVPVFSRGDPIAAMAVIVPTLKNSTPRLIGALKVAAGSVSRVLQ